MEVIEVMARFDSKGNATPLHFACKSGVYYVESTGRRWKAEDGDHILVMAPGGRVFELLFVPQEGRWYLKQVRQSRQAV
jgi:hypothetical protein